MSDKGIGVKMAAAKTYCIMRFFVNPVYDAYTVKTGLTLEEAQAHCKDPESSSNTCKTKDNMGRTMLYGGWFEGYSEE